MLNSPSLNGFAARNPSMSESDPGESEKVSSWPLNGFTALNDPSTGHVNFGPSSVSHQLSVGSRTHFWMQSGFCSLPGIVQSTTMPGPNPLGF